MFRKIQCMQSLSVTENGELCADHGNGQTVIILTREIGGVGGEELIHTVQVQRATLGGDIVAEEVGDGGIVVGQRSPSPLMSVSL